MANYKESSITGTSWTRARRVIINHPVNGESTIHFQEEVAIQSPAGTTTVPGDVIVDGFDPQRMINLLDPATGLPTGQSVPEAMVYVALYSKYMALALSRDAANQPEPQAPTEDPEATPDPV